GKLACRLSGTVATAGCAPAGVGGSRFGGEGPGLVGIGTGITRQLLAISPERGAQTSVYLASSPEVEGKAGGYYDRCKPSSPSPEARDDAAARRLWEETARITGVG